MRSRVAKKKKKEHPWGHCVDLREQLDQLLTFADDDAIKSLMSCNKFQDADNTKTDLLPCSACRLSVSCWYLEPLMEYLPPASGPYSLKNPIPDETLWAEEGRPPNTSFDQLSEV